MKQNLKLSCDCLGDWFLHTFVPRCYPPRFGLEMVSLFHDLVADKHGMPELPAVVPAAEDTFASMDFSDVWSEASMISVCRYLRKGTGLNVPPSFRNLLPKKL